MPTVDHRGNVLCSAQHREYANFFQGTSLGKFFADWRA
jgi:hypothetical protein